MNMNNKRIATTIFLVVLALLTAWFSYLIARPYLKPILSAVVLTVVFYPVHAWLHKYIRNANVASIISTLLILLLIIIPTVLIGREIKQELTTMYQALSASKSQDTGLLPQLMHVAERVSKWAGQYIDLSEFDPKAMLSEKLQQASGFVFSQTANVIGNLASFVISLVVAFLTLFYLFRDGRSMVRRLEVMIPLEPRQRRNLIGRISGTVTAGMYGVIAVALIQGLLMGLAFRFLQLPSPVLWGVLTAFISLIPIVGSSIIWAPAALFLFLNGNWVKALILIGWGAGVVGLADNIVRPYVISKVGHFHPLLIFFALLGGVQAFGLIGLFAGPVILAIGQALLDLLKEESRRKIDGI